MLTIGESRIAVLFLQLLRRRDILLGKSLKESHNQSIILLVLEEAAKMPEAIANREAGHSIQLQEVLATDNIP